MEAISDPGGCFIILRALYPGTPVILCNVYIPNISQMTFLQRLLSRLLQLPPSALILGGNFNGAFSEHVYKLLLPGRKLNPSLTNLSRSFQKLIRKFSLLDLWRICRNILLFFPASFSFPY